MNKNIYKKLKMFGIYSFRGILLQIFFVNLLFALTPTDAQKLDKIKISINISNVSLQEAIQIIEKESNLIFSYNSKEIPLNEKVSLNFNNAALSDVLIKLAQDLGLKFSQVDKLIIVKKWDETVLTPPQRGTIKGTVKDKNIKDALVGANIIVEGTNLGASADIDGNFIIHNVEVGKQALIVTYVGYKKLTININVKGDTTNEIIINLEAEAVEINSVLVTDQAKGQLQAINEQLSANNIVDIVSQEKMQELPDANIAESIGRLPGVSLERDAGEANEVVVRGLSPQFNEVTIEGIPMGSTNFQDRSIDLSVLSDNMVEGVELYKTLRPDMDANALGGMVNLELKTARPGLHYNIWGNGGYNDLRNSYDNYKFSATAGDRFLNNKLGVLVQGNLEKKQLPSDQFYARYSSPTYNSKINQFYVSTLSAELLDYLTKRQRYGISLILDYASELVDIKFFNIYDAKIDSVVTRDNVAYFAAAGFYNVIDLNKRKTEQQTNSVQALFKLGNTELPVSLSYTKGSQTEPAEQMFDFIELGLPVISPGALVYGQPASVIQERGTMNPYSSGTTLYGMGLFNTLVNDIAYDTKIDWKIPFKLSDSFSGYFSVGGKYRYVNHLSQSNAITYNMESGSQAASNRTFLINSFSFLKGVSAANQYGIPAYPFVDQTYHRSSILGYPIGPSFNPYLLADMQNYIYYTPNTANDHYVIDGSDQFYKDYTDKENTQAGYLMGEFNIGIDLTVTAGVRWQLEQTDISAYRIYLNPSNPNGLTGQPPVLVDTKSVNPDWYPSVNIKYKAANNIQMIGALYKSVSLPNYFDISPMVELPQGGGAIESGNPLLKPSTSWNYDLGVSVFNNVIGLFTVNIFYKDISNLIYSVQNYFPFSKYPMVGGPSDISSRLPGKDFYDTTWALQNNGATSSVTLPMNDPAHAYLRGIEISWQTHLWYLPGVLSGIVLDLNATFMSSNQEYPSFIVIAPRIGNKDTIQYVTSAASLGNQPKAIYNAIMGWDYKGFNARFSVSYQQTTLKNVDVRYGLEDSYFDNVLLLDVSLKQQIIDNLSVFANATNINNHIDNYYFSHPAYTTSTASYPAGELPINAQTYGWNAQFGITYNF